MRKIITYNTLGENMKEVYSSARVWGDLQPDLAEAGVRYQGLRAMTNPGQVTLESLQAELPEGEFQLFLMPQQVKSGWNQDDDEDMIDDEDGVTWDEVDWDHSDTEDYIFKSAKDLAIARSKRAFSLIKKSLAFLTEEEEECKKHVMTKPITPQPRDPMLEALKAKAAQLQSNMDVFN